MTDFVRFHAAWHGAWCWNRMPPALSLHFEAERVAGLRRVFVDCTAPALPTIGASRRRVRGEPSWERVAIATEHDAMVSAPQHLLWALRELA